MSSKLPPVVIDLTEEGRLNISIVRTIHDTSEPCVGCLVLNNKMIFYRLGSEGAWRHRSQCDICAESEAKIAAHQGGFLKKGILDLSRPTASLVVDLKRHTPDMIRINVARAEASQMRACECCRELTNRTTAFRLNTEKAWRPIWVCDDCCGAASRIIAHQGGFLKGSING